MSNLEIFRVDDLKKADGKTYFFGKSHGKVALAKFFLTV